MKFSELVFKPHPAAQELDLMECPGKPDQKTRKHEQAHVYFPNGFGASVITGPWFYTSQHGLYEVAVLNADGSLCYSTPITDDVIGYCTAEEVEELLAKIEALPNRE